MEIPAAPYREDNQSSRKIQLVEGVDFFSCCRLCVTSYDHENMTPLFVDAGGLISSKITKIIPLEIKNGDGLPDSICNNCVEKINFVDNFIEKSLTADRLLRKVLTQARAANAMCTSAVLEVVDAVDLLSTESDLIVLGSEPISSNGKPSSIEPITVNDKPSDFDDEPMDSPSNPVTSKDESPARSEPFSEKVSDILGDHSYCLASDLPADPPDPPEMGMEKGVVVPKLAKPNSVPETTSEYINFVDNDTGQTSYMPLECCIVSSHELRTRLEPDKQQATGDLTCISRPLNLNDEILSKKIIRKKIIPEQNIDKKQTDRKPRPFEPVRSVYCEICGKEFSRRTRLRDHMYSHTGERPFSCPTCGKAYPRRYELKKHVLTHTEPPDEIARFVCDICGRRHTSVSNLHSHMVVHSNNRPFTCPICDKSFKHKGHLRGHLLVHTDEKPFLCTLCGKNFKLEKSYVTHMATHIKTPKPPQELTPSGVRDFECHHCKKWFFCHTSLKRHIQVVHVAKLFPCTVCGRNFKDLSYVSKHVLKMHRAVSGHGNAYRSSVNVSLQCDIMSDVNSDTL